MGHTVLALMVVDDEEVRLWRGGGGGALRIIHIQRKERGQKTLIFAFFQH